LAKYFKRNASYIFTAPWCGSEDFEEAAADCFMKGMLAWQYPFKHWPGSRVLLVLCSAMEKRRLYDNYLTEDMVTAWLKAET